jgi:internalin A
MKKIKIFIASSHDLAEERMQIEFIISKINSKSQENDYFLEMELWESFIDAMSQTRLQDQYNQMISNSDIFILLLSTKIGKYTTMEFEQAFKEFKINNKPFILTFFKETKIQISQENSSELMSFFTFQEKLKNLGLLYSWYKDENELTRNIEKSLLSLIDSKFQVGNTNKKESNKNKITSTILGNSNTIIQGITSGKDSNINIKK